MILKDVLNAVLYEVGGLTVGNTRGTGIRMVKLNKLFVREETSGRNILAE